ncbi:MAG: hypothetical protein HQK70_10695 [Desulfamplus sp.]|nr:hypothetical protein [Desulfamplus sp.]
MKQNKSLLEHQPEEELRAEYDFKGAVRGKHYRPINKGYTLKIYKTDGSTEIQEMTSEKWVIRLDPDIQQYFHDSTSVNQALRSLLSLMTQFPNLSKKGVKNTGA